MCRHTCSSPVAKRSYEHGGAVVEEGAAAKAEVLEQQLQRPMMDSNTERAAA